MRFSLFLNTRKTALKKLKKSFKLWVTVLWDMLGVIEVETKPSTKHKFLGDLYLHHLLFIIFKGNFSWHAKLKGYILLVSAFMSSSVVMHGLLHIIFQLFWYAPQIEYTFLQSYANDPGSWIHIKVCTQNIISDMEYYIRMKLKIDKDKEKDKDKKSIISLRKYKHSCHYVLPHHSL